MFETVLLPKIDQSYYFKFLTLKFPVQKYLVDMWLSHFEKYNS